MRLQSALKLSTLALAVSGSGFSLLASAQENTLETIVVTADRRQSELRDIPASISSVGALDLTTVRATHINEILTRIPGTWISRGNGQESLISIRSPVLTGAGSCGAFQTSLDGIPMRAPGFCNVNQLFEANTEQAGRIEVIRGPGSILYGANALHGAINVISPQLSEQPSSDYSLDLGPHQYQRVSGTISDTRGPNAYRASFNGTSDDGYKDDSGFGQQKLSLQHRYSGSGLTVTNSFHATNLNQETAGYIQGPDAYKDESLKKNNPNPEAFRDARSYRLSSQLVWETDLADWTLTPYYRKTEMTFLQHYLPGAPLEENGQRSFGLQAMVASHGDTQLSWQLGMDLETTDGYLKETQAAPTVGSAFLVGTIPAGKHYDFDVNAELFSPYALLKYELDEQNLVSLGLRYEDRQYDYDNKMLVGRTRDDGTNCGFGGCRFNRPADRSDSFQNVSAQIGYIHNFDDAQQVYVNLAQAFRAPETNEIYRLQNNQVVADLDSEEARSLEVGYRASRGQVNYAVAAYYMNKDNVIYQNSSRENIGGAQTRHRGIELNMGYAFNEAWLLTLAGSYARHTYAGNDNPGAPDLNGNDIDGAPRLTGSAQLNWQIGQNRSIELELVHMDSYYTDSENTAEYAGHDLVNLRYRASFNQNWYYSARVTNLFDTDYAERADYAFGNERYFVGEPISAYLTIGRKI